MAKRCAGSVMPAKPATHALGHLVRQLARHVLEQPVHIGHMAVELKTPAFGNWFCKT